MKRRKRAVPLQPLYTKETFVVLAQKHGYTCDDAGDESVTFFLNSLHDEMRTAIRVALLDADNKNQRALTVTNVDAINSNMKTFTK